MRAAIAGRYGTPIEIGERPAPEPGAGRVRVRVKAAAVTSGDARMRAGRFPRGFATLGKLALGVRKPRRPVLGVAFSGVVETVGRDVTTWAPGDEVAGMTGASLGAHAELVVVRGTAIAAVPPGLAAEHAAAVLFGGSTALCFLRDRAALRSGERLLVNGASGSVGSAAVQLGKHVGARVTAVTSARNAELVSRLGADEVVDYESSPVTGLGDRFDVVFDAVGNVSRREGLRMLAPGGRLVLAVADLADTVRSRRPVFAGSAPERADDFATLMDLASRGVVDPLTEVIGPLDAIGEAYRRVDSGRKVGNLVVTP